MRPESLLTDILTVEGAGTFKARRDGNRGYVFSGKLDVVPDVKPGDVVSFERQNANRTVTKWVVVSTFARNGLTTLDLRSEG